MKKNKNIIIIVSLLILSLLFAGYIIFTKKASKEKTTQKEIESSLKKEDATLKISPLFYEIEGDRVLGDKKAPITIVEYASLSCIHCAKFHNNVFKEVKNEYIDNGKVKLIFRDFPLDRPALAASAVANCVPDSEYYKALEMLFKNQNQWAFIPDFVKKLSGFSKVLGLKKKQLEECLANEDLVNEIIKKGYDAAKELDIKSTPTFFINGKKIIGYRSFKEIKEIIDSIVVM